MYDKKTDKLTDKVFKVEFYLKPKRGNMSKKRLKEILDNVTTGMNRQYRDEIKQSSSNFIYEYPASSFIFRGKIN